MYSFFKFRSESVHEVIKMSIYKKALTINQNSLVTPKFQRIHDGVSKVFGIDDPPPGWFICFYVF